MGTICPNRDLLQKQRRILKDPLLTLLLDHPGEMQGVQENSSDGLGQRKQLIQQGTILPLIQKELGIL